MGTRGGVGRGSARRCHGDLCARRRARPARAGAGGSCCPAAGGARGRLGNAEGPGRRARWRRRGGTGAGGRSVFVAADVFGSVADGRQPPPAGLGFIFFFPTKFLFVSGKKRGKIINSF